jgi:hypothetical protein
VAKNKKKPKLSLQIVDNLGLYYVQIEEDGEEVYSVGPFKDAAGAEAERDLQKKLRKKKII